MILPVEAGGDDLDEEISTSIKLPEYEHQTALRHSCSQITWKSDDHC